MNSSPRRALRRVLETLRLDGISYRIAEWAKARRLSRSDRAAFAAPAADGLPVPPAALIVLVGGETSVEAFLRGGKDVVDAMREQLRAGGGDLDACVRILDFGCGCGRVLRHLRDPDRHRQLHGTDYNRRLIRWCRSQLPFATFGVNALQPPLRYADAAFDLVCAFSIFTHLPESLQRAWFDELARVLAPGGFLFLTVHGVGFRHVLDAGEQRAFDAGELVVRHARMAGSNMCSAFHSVACLQRLAAPHFTLASHQPARFGQDAVLLRRNV